jgi:hypothetical protein
LINCPSCGSNFEGNLRLGCPSCGARSVGPPLAKPEHELPSYGRAVIVSASGVAMSGAFLASVIMALIEFKGFPPSLLSIVKAGEVASWRLKWVTVPVAIVVFWSGARIIRSIKENPSAFIGLRAARLGLVASVLVMLTIGTLIGITIPQRLRQRQLGIEAGIYAQGYTLQLALLEYRGLHGTLPANDEWVEKLSTLPDPDGSIAEALRNIDATGYQAGTVLAAASSKSKPLAQRGSAISKAGTGADPATDHGGVSFTSYDLRLPGPDRILNNDDDFLVHDGVITKVSELPASSARPNVP